MLICFAFSSAQADIYDGLVAWYPFDGDAKDASGNGHHGTIHGVSFINTDMGSKAAFFNGTTDYISVDISIYISKDWSVTFWCKIEKFNSQ